MSQSDAERRVRTALTDSDVLSPEGSAVAQDKSGSLYVAIPRRLVDHHGIEAGDELRRAYDPASGILLVSLDGSDLFE